jgi:hypothetical protein
VTVTDDISITSTSEGRYGGAECLPAYCPLHF